ncbi:MAG: magnesium transporter [Cyclobacteriaceae bacterium]|nr:magnesium transporter [Cyclobacteriaceae bacterium]
MTFELSRDYIDKLKEAIAAQDDTFIRNSFDGIDPSDIASVLEELDDDESRYIIDLLDDESAADILNDTDPDMRSKLLRTFDPPRINAFLDHLETDDVVDIINELPVKLREEIVAGIENEERAQYIIDLLRYEDDCAGGLMAKELIKANLNWNVVQCIEEIRRQAENVEKIYSVYVVDSKNKLLGRVSLKKIIISEDKTLVKNIYEPDVVAVETYYDQEEVVSIMRKYDLESVPVVNGVGKLVGRITIDDVMDVMAEMAEEERQLMSGISEDVEEDDSIWMITRARLPWLIIGLAGGLVGAWFIGLFETDIVMIPAMAFFIPLITATGGNVGIQSSAIVVQSLADKSGLAYDNIQRVMKGLFVSLINGLVLAAIALSFSLVLGQTFRLGTIVAFSLFCVVILASIMGTITPLILDKIGINPALAAGPFITTANDLLGLGVYFTIAHFLYTA